MEGHTDAGVTLIELMVALSVLAIVLTVGVPSLAGFVNSQKLDSTLQLLKDSYSLARYEAVTRQQSVILCPLNIATGDCGTDWGAGVISFLDLDNDKRFDSTIDELLRQSYFSDAVSVNWNRSGLLRVSGSGSVDKNGSFTLKVSGTNKSKRLIISSTGRIRVD